MTIIRCNAVVREPTTVVDLITWVYRSQKADLMSGKDLFVPQQPSSETKAAPGRSSLADVLEAGRLGAVIRGTAARQRSLLHPDAEAIHDRVVEMSRADWLGPSLLLRCGRAGAVPDYADEVPQPLPVHRMKGRREVVVEDAMAPGESHLEAVADGNTLAWVEVPHPHCPLQYWPTIAEIERSRVDYRAWWRALRDLAAGLPPLQRWNVTGLGAEEQPWRWDAVVSGRGGRYSSAYDPWPAEPQHG